MKRFEQQATKAPSLDWTTMFASPAIAQLACIQHVYDAYCWHHLRRDLPDVRDAIGYIEAVFRVVPDAEVQAYYKTDGLYFTSAGGRGLEGFGDAAGALGAREQFPTPTYDETKAIVAFAGPLSAFRAGGRMLETARSLRTNPNSAARHYTDFADEATEIMENAARGRGLNPNAGVRAMAAPIRDVDISKLVPPPTRSFADPGKLQRLGPFDWSKYRPIQVEDLGGGLYIIMDGMTRLEAARRAGITKLPVQIFPKSGP